MNDLSFTDNDARLTIETDSAVPNKILFSMWSEQREDDWRFQDGIYLDITELKDLREELNSFLEAYDL